MLSLPNRFGFGPIQSVSGSRYENRQLVGFVQKVFKLRERGCACQWCLKLALRQRHRIDARIRSKDTSSKACRFEWHSPTSTKHIGHQLTGLTVPQDEVLGNRTLELPYVRRQLMQRTLLMCAGLRPVWRCRGGHGHEFVIVHHRVHSLHGYPSLDQLSQPFLAEARRLSRRFSRMDMQCCYTNQFSTWRAGIRSKWRTFPVTTVYSRTRAVAPMSTSSTPISSPRRAKRARMSPATTASE